jgi:5-methylthioribose kinase
MVVLGERLLPGDVPRVLFIDEQASLLGMSQAPEHAFPWKQQLLQGEVDLGVARRAGALLGRMHRAAWGDQTLATRFRDLALFRQLRLDPYHGRAAVAAEERGEHDLAQLLRTGAAAMTQNCSTLVHGDYSPKNLLVHEGGLMALDFEVVHWGNPDFDTAFMLTHLALKAIHRPAAAPALAQAAESFLGSYADAVGIRQPADVAEGALRQAGCLLRARADGKSRAEYLDHAGLAAARRLSGQVMRGAISSVAAMFQAVEES